MCDELQRHGHHIWNVEAVKALVADGDPAATFFCGGSRNYSTFIDLVHGVLILVVDLDTLNQRLDARPDDEWGGVPPDRALIVRWHPRHEGVPTNGVVIDATALTDRVAEEILRRCQASSWSSPLGLPQR